jgi:orotidine-5'-phosphate decarboxylase
MVLEALEEAQPSVVKPQVALFERQGLSGMQSLATLLAGLREKNILIVGDAKRGDIGSTMRAYAEAWLTPGKDFEVDALTLNPYLGLGSLEPALELCQEHEKGAFVLCATSNPEAQVMQRARRSKGLTLAAGVAYDLAQWIEARPTADAALCGLVVGATVNQADTGLDLSRYPNMPILAPGFGAQGALLDQAVQYFPHSTSVVATVSRSVLEGPFAGLAARFQKACFEVQPS